MLVRRLNAIAEGAQRLVAAMDFGSLFDPVRKLFSIGFRVREERSTELRHARLEAAHQLRGDRQG